MRLKMQENKIYNMDCIEGMKQIENNTIDCVWIDPPYNINYKYDKYDDNKNDIDYQKLLKTIAKEFNRIIKPNKVIFIKQFHKNLHLTLNIFSKYFNLKDMIIWKNSSPAQPKDRFKPIYEIILMFVSGPGPIYFNDKFETRKCQVQWDKKRNDNYYGKITNLWDDIPPIYAGSIKHREGVYKENTNKKSHPAQHPIKLVTRSIGFVTKENDLILDCFIGSGTTAVACKQLNRNFIGFELSKEYCDIANERLKQSNIKEWF